MLGLIKKLFGGKPAEATAEAPYKVEVAPANIQQEGTVEAPAQTTPVAEQASQAMVESVAPAKKPAAKKPAPKKPQAVKKPAAPKTAKPKTAPKPKAKPAV
jgi:hypothetical protein